MKALKAEEKTVKKSRLIEICLFLIAVAGVLDTIMIYSKSGGMDLGILLPSLGGVCIILALLFRKTALYRKNMKACNRVGKLVIGLFAVWLLSFFIVSGILAASAISERDEKVDCVIVLGAGLKGETPTLVLLERLNNALIFLAENPGTGVIVSGGQGPGEAITEAEAMKRYLVGNGVSEESIIKEEKSTSTYENMLFSKVKYEEATGKKLEKIMIITNDFHMFRSKILAGRAGLQAYGISSGTPWYIYPNVFLREYFAVFKSLIFDR